MGVGDPRHRVGGAGAGGRDADPHFPAGAGIAFRRVDAVLFVAGFHLHDFVVHPVKSVKQRDDAAAGIGEHTFDTLFLQAADHDFRASQYFTIHNHRISSLPQNLLFQDGAFVG